MPSPFLSLRVYRAVLTASYAGTLSLQSSALPPPSTLTFTGHDLSALSATYVPHPLGSEDKRWVASGGMDRVGRVWEYTVRQTGLVVLATCLLTLHSPVDPVSFTHDSRRGRRTQDSLHALPAPSPDRLCPLSPSSLVLRYRHPGSSPPHGRLGWSRRSLGFDAGHQRGRRRARGRRAEEEAEKAVGRGRQQGAFGAIRLPTTKGSN